MRKPVEMKQLNLRKPVFRTLRVCTSDWSECMRLSEESEKTGRDEAAQFRKPIFRTLRVCTSESSTDYQKQRDKNPHFIDPLRGAKSTRSTLNIGFPAQ